MMPVRDSWRPEQLTRYSGLDSEGALTELVADRNALVATVERTGALVLPALLDDSDAFDRLVGTLFPPTAALVTLSSPRSRRGNAIFSSTEYSRSRTLPLHQELAYLRRWPKYCLFYCENPPLADGETTLGELASLSDALPPALLDEFCRRGLRYRMYFREGFEPTWQAAFGTDDIEQACALARSSGFEVRCPADGLIVEFSAQGALRGTDGKLRWVNQAHLFHWSGLAEDQAARLIDGLGLEALPRHCRFADGEEIPASVMSDVRTAFATGEVAHRWVRGDVLILDNSRILHGRRAFSGERKILAAFSGIAGPNDG